MRVAIPVVARLLGARGRVVFGWLVIIGILAWFQGDALLRSLHHTLLGPRINGDAQQQIFPFFRYYDQPSAFTDDYVSEYYLACYPLGYFGLYATAAKLGIDPAVVSRALPHLMWLLAVIFLGAAAHKLGGKLTALAAMALMLGSNVYLFRTSGGLPRSFGFPILGATLFALAYARVFWCAACVLLGALFYPVVAVIAGLSLACLLLFPRICGLPKNPWSLGRRLAVLAGTAAVACLLLAPSTLSSRRFGDLVRPADVHEFPEAGKGGRYAPNSRAPFRGFFVSVPDAMAGVLSNGGRTWSPSARAWLGGKKSERRRGLLNVLFASMLVGGLALFVRRPAARRVMLLGVASGLGYTLARYVAPYAYLPDRYVAYSVPLLGTLLVSTAVAGSFPTSFHVGWRRWVRLGSVGAHVVALLWLLGGRVSPDTGLDVNVRRARPLVRHIAGLPVNAVIAGWPAGTMNFIPHVTHRRALLTLETHQAFHKGYVMEMRRRMYGLIDAYFATSVEPILALRDELGVTHLLVERSHFEGAPPRYFKPFDEAIARRLRSARGKSFELPKRLRRASVFSYRDFELLDLSRIDAAPVPSAEPPRDERERRR